MWEISGEAGKKLGVETRLASEVAQDVTLTFESLQPDKVSWSAVGRLADYSDLALPELGEEITVKRSGVNWFKGIVTAVPASVAGDSISAQVTASGAHWWLEKTPATDLVRDADEAEQERAILVFPEGSIEAHLRKLFDRAKAAGLPVELGEVAECYDVPQMTVSEGSFADALASLVRMVPDAMTWWDYSGTGNPKFNLSRRASAEVLDLAYGSAPLVSAKLQPRLGLETEEVVVQYAERGEDGLVRYREQSAGVSVTGKRQVVVTSGESLADIVPPDPIESVTISSVDMYNGGGGYLEATLKAIWPFWKDLDARFTLPSLSVDQWEDSSPDNTRYTNGLEIQYFDEDGTALTEAGTDLDQVITVPRGDIPDWLATKLGLVPVNLVGTLWIEYDNTSGFPDWLDYSISNLTSLDTANTGPSVIYRMFFDVDIPLYAYEGGSAVTDEVHYEPLAYQFNTPPPGFADALRQAQGFLPYQGEIHLTEQVAGGKDALGRVVNVAGALPEWESMRALVQGMELTLSDGSQVLRLGAPQRLSLQDIVKRLRVDRRDNVVQS